MSDTAPTGYQNRYELRNRYVFRGQIVMQTALHIGGGKATLSSSDSPIVLTPDQKPFIPGSSFKGALRSTVEKIVPALPIRANFSSCALLEQSELLFPEKLNTSEPPPPWPEGACPTAYSNELRRLRREFPAFDEAIIQDAITHLCSTCHLFGSPLTSAHVYISDLYVPPGEWLGVVQTRDGVSIDRDSEKARDRLKYDFEVVPASTTFALEITLENATQEDLQLLCVGLSEFVNGFGTIGGKRSRGLGVARLTELYVWELDLEVADVNERNNRLANFLISKRFSGEKLPGETFLQDHIKLIFSSGGTGC